LRIQKAIDERWSYTGELFMMSKADKAMLEENIGMNLEQAKEEWITGIHEILTEATIIPPSDQAWMQKGGKEGVHSEHLGFILAEIQHMQRTYPGMEW
jgi:ring-1,2-phenylacetyl-CoA epoxidase subunit PaaC